jgi:hypothetical protein
MDRDEMLQREEQGWLALEAEVARLPDDRRVEPGVVPGWSAHDLVWHCGKWAEWGAERLEEMVAGTYEDTATPEEYWSGLNERWGEDSKQLSWDEVLAGVAAMRNRAREALEQLPEVDRDATREFSTETFEHYAEHAAEIARFADASS